MYFFPLQKGFTLIEALVSLIILSLAMLGILELQFQLLRSEQSLYFYNQALQQAQNAVEIQKFGRSPEALAVLKTEIQSILPAGELSISETQVEVRWKDIAIESNADVGEVKLWIAP